MNEREIVDVENSEILWDMGQIIHTTRFVSDARWPARIFYREDVVAAIREAKLPKIRIIDPCNEEGYFNDA